MEVIFLKGTGDETEFTARFRSATLSGLLDAYNSQVGNRGWVSAKGRYLYSLYHEFKRRQIDISVIDSGNGMTMNRRVRLDRSGKHLMLDE